ncbi:MAG: class I SAM-dependent methyltransferase [Crocinitomicaceae bacterium]|nr:class I SAM-dependent methyltransferase [Crocinitomicaceae bacterium]
MKRLFLFLINNRCINQFWILIGKDNFVKKYQSNWAKLKYDESKSTQENVGFSHNKETQEAIDSVHKQLQASYLEHSNGNQVLDIGCGTGLYLVDFPDSAVLTGTDLSQELLKKAKNVVPKAKLLEGDFLSLNFDSNFDFIFSISVIEYVPPSKLNRLSQKVKLMLNAEGIVFIQYPHATTNEHLYYSDLSYVHYSPRKMEKAFVNSGFDIVSHVHSFDGRTLSGIKKDDKTYDPEKEKSFRNGAILIARKK